MQPSGLLQEIVSKFENRAEALGLERRENFPTGRQGRPVWGVPQATFATRRSDNGYYFFWTANGVDAPQIFAYVGPASLFAQRRRALGRAHRRLAQDQSPVDCVPVAVAIKHCLHSQARGGSWGRLAGIAEMTLGWTDAAGDGIIIPLRLSGADDLPFLIDSLVWYVQLLLPPPAQCLTPDEASVARSPGGVGEPSAPSQTPGDANASAGGLLTPPAGRSRRTGAGPTPIPEPWWVSCLRQFLYKRQWLLPCIALAAMLAMKAAPLLADAAFGTPRSKTMVARHGHYFAVTGAKKVPLSALQYWGPAITATACIDFMVVGFALQLLLFGRIFLLKWLDEATVLRGWRDEDLDSTAGPAVAVPAPPASAGCPPQYFRVLSALPAAEASRKLGMACRQMLEPWRPAIVNETLAGSFVLSSGYFIGAPRRVMEDAYTEAFVLAGPFAHKTAQVLCLQSPAGRCGLVRVELRGDGPGSVAVVSKGLTFGKRLRLWITCCFLTLVFSAAGFGVGGFFLVSMKDPDLRNPIRLGAAVALALCGFVCSLPFWTAARRWVRAARPDLATVASQLEAILKSADAGESPSALAPPAIP